MGIVARGPGAAGSARLSPRWPLAVSSSVRHGSGHLLRAGLHVERRAGLRLPRHRDRRDGRPRCRRRAAMPPVCSVLAVSDPRIPCDPARNTAALAAAEVLRRARGAGVGLELRVEKGLPLSGGLGGSAASAVAGAFAANALLGRPLDAEALLRCALEAEAVVAGRHPDNAAPSLLGGARPSSSASSRCATPASPSTPRCASSFATPGLPASRPPAPVPFSPRASRGPTRWGRPRPWPVSSWASERGDGEPRCAPRWWTAWPSPHRIPLYPGYARAREAALAGGALRGGGERRGADPPGDRAGGRARRPSGAPWSRRTRRHGFAGPRCTSPAWMPRERGLE